MFYVYILESLKNRELYVGYTDDLKKRLEKHNQGLSPYTKKYLPWEIIYYEACLSKKNAIRREGYLKTSQGRKMIKMRLREYLYNKK